MAAFMKSPGLFYLPEDGEALPGQKDYLAALDGTPVYEIAGGVDFEQAARACREIMAVWGEA
jgi:HprK-related kinase B